MTDLGDIGGMLLEPINTAAELVAQALDTIGEGIEFSGAELEKFAGLVAALAAKVSELQAHLRDNG